jgi:hypothetical protein
MVVVALSIEQEWIVRLAKRRHKKIRAFIQRDIMTSYPVLARLLLTVLCVREEWSG